MIEDNDNPLIPGSKAQREEEEKEKKEVEESDESNPYIAGGKAAEKEEEKEARGRLESPAVNPLIPGSKAKEGAEVLPDLEDHFKEHDILQLGEFNLVKNFGEPGTFKLIGTGNHEIQFSSLEEAQKVLEGLSPEEIKSLFFK